MKRSDQLHVGVHARTWRPQEKVLRYGGYSFLKLIAVKSRGATEPFILGWLSSKSLITHLKAFVEDTSLVTYGSVLCVVLRVVLKPA